MAIFRFSLACFPASVLGFSSSACIRSSQSLRSSSSAIQRLSFSSTSHSRLAATSVEEQEGIPEVLLHPDQLGEIPLPKALSPSAVLTFKQCPQSFLLQYLYKIRQPKTTALAKGSMCHEALEKVFDLDPDDRNLENLQNLLRKCWGESRFDKDYKDLFDDEDGQRDIQTEKEWGESALQLLQNYYKVEDPRSIVRPNPLRREIWLHNHLALDPSLGVTSPTHDSSLNIKKSDTFYVRGIVDRIDMVRMPETNQVVLRIVDYKTGKAPNLKYSRPTNERIVEEAFYQLKIYALLLRENGAGKAQPKGMDLRFLQLFYLNSESGEAKIWEYDLGETEEERDLELNAVHQDLSNVWTTIVRLVKQQDPMAFVGCDRSFCFCHEGRDKFEDGTLWKPDA
ncbi:MAG: hypothetical protein SGBAC_007036 [Bacillariaceae sp.]